MPTTVPRISLEMLGKLGTTDSAGKPATIVIQRVAIGKGNGRIEGNRQIQVRRENPDRRDAMSHAQVARRSRFQDAVAAWQGMSAEERAPWIRRARKESRTGYNLFISDWLKAHP